jgi:hypothetical protein
VRTPHTNRSRQKRKSDRFRPPQEENGGCSTAAATQFAGVWTARNCFTSRPAARLRRRASLRAGPHWKSKEVVSRSDFRRAGIEPSRCLTLCCFLGWPGFPHKFGVGANCLLSRHCKHELDRSIEETTAVWPSASAGSSKQGPNQEANTHARDSS